MAPQRPTYVVNPDKTVTFQLSAPKAATVELTGDFLQGNQAMNKADTGVWSITVGPLKPRIYNYAFLIDGLHVPDPQNPMPTFQPPRRVPHGVTLIGRLFDEGTLGRAGLALERSFDVIGDRPPGF